MNEYFPKPNFLEVNVDVKLDFSNYVTKADLKNSAGIDTSKFAKKVDLASLKSNVDILDIDKLEDLLSGLISLKIKVNKLDVYRLVPVPVDLSKLNDLVKTMLLKRCT